MTVSGLTPVRPTPDAKATQSEIVTTALARALRQQRDEAAALVKLVEQTTAAGDKGQHVNYYA